MKHESLRSQTRARLAQLRAEWDLPEPAVERLERLVVLVATDPEAPTSVAAPLEVLDAHIADSLTALSIEGISATGSIVDIGSGAGFPGLVLAAALPESRVDLLESVRKKCDFIERVSSQLELANVRAVCARAEEWGADPAAAGEYSAATARAVGRLATILEYAAPLLEIGGLLVAWKGGRDRAEEAEAARAAAVLGMGPALVERVQPYAGSRNRHLHVYRKLTASPPGYPRRPGMARKRPLGTAKPPASE